MEAFRNEYAVSVLCETLGVALSGYSGWKKRPNEQWTGDMTAIWTYEGWLYLAVVLDLYSRRVIGWAMAATQDEALIERAFQMALLTRHPQTGVLCAFGSGIAVYQ